MSKNVGGETQKDLREWEIEIHRQSRALSCLTGLNSTKQVNMLLIQH